MKLYIITLAIILYTTGFIYMHAQSSPGEYLSKHSIVIASNDSIGIKNVENVRNYKLFLVGESHGFKNNYRLRSAWFEFLNKNANTRVLLWELPFSFEKIINRCIQTGDSNDVILIAGFIAGNNIENRKYLWDLYFLNKSLPANAKIINKCVDIEHDREVGLHFLINLYFNKTLVGYPNGLPEETIHCLKRLIRLTIKMIPASRKKLDKIIIRTQNDMLKNEKHYRAYLDTSYTDFKKIIDGLVLLKKIENEKVKIVYSSIREKQIYLNIKSVINEYPNESYFGQFGKRHTTLSKGADWLCTNNWSSSASMLNTDSTSNVQNKILSILINYVSDPRESSSFCNNLINKQDLELFKAHSSSSLTMFKLDAEGTPFKKMAENFQYIIINK